MIQSLLISNIVLWISVIAMGVVIIALLRQIGVLHERVAPAGALMIGQGPKVGEVSPVLQLQDISGSDVTVGGVSEEGRSKLIFYLSPTCPVCKTLLPALRSSQRSESDWLDFVLASDGDMQSQLKFVAEYKLDEFKYVVSTELGITFQVGRLPYAVLIDESGVIRSKGLVNSREQLESIFEAKERGLASIQEYIGQHREDVA